MMSHCFQLSDRKVHSNDYAKEDQYADNIGHQIQRLALILENDSELASKIGRIAESSYRIPI
jgi:hypothetical protein